MVSPGLYSIGDGGGYTIHTTALLGMSFASVDSVATLLEIVLVSIADDAHDVVVRDGVDVQQVSVVVTCWRHVSLRPDHNTTHILCDR